MPKLSQDPEKNTSALVQDRDWLASWWFLGGCLVLLVGLAYSNSLHGAFVYDDQTDVLGNLQLRRLWPLSEILKLGGLLVNHPRPVPVATFALDFAMGGGASILPFHLSNLVIHTLATLALFGLVRRALALSVIQEGLCQHRNGLAFLAAALWGLHPLQTESVSYVTQRYESLMGFFFLMTLYCLVRRWQAPRTVRWTLGTIVFCLLALLSKEVAVVLPLLVVLFDQILLSRSWRAGWARNKFLYLGLLLALAGFAAVQLHIPHRTFAGVGEALVPWWQYGLTEFGVILHYIRLALWPSPLVFDYQWPVARSWGQILPGLLLVGGLILATCWGLWRRSFWGLLGACFFLPLAPTSSIMPILDLAVEHRMYLSLAPILLGLLLLAFRLVERLADRWPMAAERIRFYSFATAVLVAVLLGCKTFVRNEDYKGPVNLWADTVTKRPNNPRAHLNLAAGLGSLGFDDEAILHLKKALELAPESPFPHINLGVILIKAGRLDEGLRELETAIKKRPSDPRGWANAAAACIDLGRLGEAERCARAAIDLDPTFADGYMNLGMALCASGRVSQALPQFEKAWELNPFRSAFRWTAGRALLVQGQTREAEAQFDRAASLDGNPEDSLSFRGRIYYEVGMVDQALAAWAQVLRQDPRHTQTWFRVAWARATHPSSSYRSGSEAVRAAQEGLKLVAEPTAAMRDVEAAAWAEAGDFPRACDAAQKAVAGVTGVSADRANQFAARLAGYREGKANRDVPVVKRKGSPLTCPI